MEKSPKLNKISQLELFEFKDYLRKPGAQRKVPEHQIEATQNHILDLLKLQNTSKKHRPSPRSVEKSMEFLEYIDQEGGFGIFNDNYQSRERVENLDVDHLLR